MKVPDTYAGMITKYSQQYQVHPAILAAKAFQESGFNPNAVNGDDRGILQINRKAYPNITDAQAYDPEFSFDFAARTLSENTKYFNDLSRAIAAYNVGRGGASVKGPTPYGGGPLGQQYLDRVSRNLSPELIRELGLKVSY